jgi:hypothetical protein
MGQVLNLPMVCVANLVSSHLGQAGLAKSDFLPPQHDVD